MTQAFTHRPVMAAEVADLLATVAPGLFVDATLGGAGHALAVLAANAGLRLVGIDRDPDALAAAEVHLAPVADRVVALHHARFDLLPSLVTEPVSAVLLDLGVSSPQFDRPDRGFSYRAEGPLDMRMDRTQRRTAADIVNRLGEDALTRLLVTGGEGRFARRIARTLVARRPIETTSQLVDAVKDAIPAPARRSGGHPAKRVFQALRIAVNDELDVLGPTVDGAIAALAPGGRIVVLAYHSGEDRIVKDRLVRASTGGCVCPPGLPCVCGAVPLVRLLNRGARKPSPAEVAENRRAESARLRAAERLPGPEDRDDDRSERRGP
ncbi:MAG TPA: 16S rRNA (cytosine(1402)-N(4))-methyltransferase RsmH [Acidimicrobiales bacterium]|nr:16S rRNA (cytosine(1402)-N(4))-methyltransferase RsmH [Acidimicrobiales bacterium]